MQQQQTPSSQSVTEATLRVAVIGLGVGEKHIDGYASHPACEVAVLCDISPERRDEVARRHPDVSIVEDAGAVLADPSIDVVSIATYDDVHASQVMEAIGKGKHVFVEKPLCLTSEDTVRIRKALDDNPTVKLSSNLILRCSPRFGLVRDMIHRGDFGQIFHLDGAYNYGRLHKLTEGWRGRIDGYTVVLGGGVHLVDQMLWLMGKRVVEVAAFGNGIASTGTGFDGDDMAAALLRFENGATATVTANFGCVRPHGHGLAVYGTKATFVNDEPHGRLYTSRDRDVAPQPITEPHPGAAKDALIPSFLDDVLGRGPAIVSAEDVFMSMSVCLAIDEARRHRAVVPVEYL